MLCRALASQICEGFKSDLSPLFVMNKCVCSCGERQCYPVKGVLLHGFNEWSWRPKIPRGDSYHFDLLRLCHYCNPCFVISFPPPAPAPAPEVLFRVQEKRNGEDALPNGSW